VRFSKASSVLALGLLAVATIPRLIGINDFATIDEPYWLTAGSDFYYALGQREFGKTIYDYHPAVTTTWIVTGAMLIYFPQYRGLGEGYFDVYKDSLDRFLLSHDRAPLGLLSTARILQILLIALLLVLVFWLLRRLLGDEVAIAATLLISFDPFFLGHSRLLNHEALLSLLVLISVFALMLHLFLERKWLYVAGSGVAAGLAQLTKSSSIAVAPLIGLLFVAEVLSRTHVDWRRRLRAALSDLAIWLVALAAVYFLLWPGMWVAPATMLQEVFGNALSYAFEGARLSAITPASATPFLPRFGDIVLYVQSVLWRTTPVVWIGFLLGVWAAIRQGWRRRIVLGSVLLAGVLFIFLFGLAGGRNSAHYVLTSYVAADILAAAGLAHSAGWLGERLPRGGRRMLPAAIIIAAGLQAVSAVPFFPYYYTYYSPIMEALQPGRQNPNFGYGEGLDLAAAYLAAKPAAPDSRAVSFYGRGPFSYFYPGETEPLKTAYADSENVPQLREVLHKSDYLVIYYALERGRNSPANVIRALEVAVPEKTIWLNDIEYVRIYDLRAMPPAFYARLSP
jgi:4-amino-4-deoxy-L-arabinose transferase-like glycosyltransferase